MRETGECLYHNLTPGEVCVDCGRTCGWVCPVCGTVWDTWHPAARECPCCSDGFGE